MKNTASHLLGCCFLGGAIVVSAAGTHAATITFNDASHGQIIDDEYLATYGLSISADNLGGGPDLPVAFDTNTTDPTSDPDLLNPWDGGNLDPNTNLGRALIIQENGSDANGDGFIDVAPDDEASRPAGTLLFEFSTAITEFGFDLIDVEGPEIGSDRGYFAVFYNDGAELGKVLFSDLIDSGSAYYRPGVEFGDNYANRIAPFTLAELGISAFDEVHVNFGGSAAIDNIVFTPVPVPAPFALAALGMGLTGLALRRRKQRE